MSTTDVNKEQLKEAAAPYTQPKVGDIAKASYTPPQKVGEIARGNYLATPTQPVVSSGSQSNAMSGGSSSSNAMANTQTVPSGMMGIRDTLVQRGVNTNRIGWNDATKSVTIDGKDAFSPSTVVNGTSYATKQDINNLTDTAYRNSGDPIAGATSYVASQGLSNAVTWSDGNLMIGGTQVPVMYVDDNGKAYARKSDIDNAIAMYKASSGITGNQGVYDNWESDYGRRIDNALNKVMNREKWEYNPEDDPAYQAYKEAYTRDGNRAYQDAYAQMAANTGGYGSSAGVTAAGQQMNYYMQQLGDRIPELMQNSYNRYVNEQELNQAALSSLLNVANDDYNKAYTANRDSISDAATAGYYDYLRDTDARDYNRQVALEERQWPYQEALLKQQVESGAISNQMANIQSVLSKYQYSGNIDTPISVEDAQILGASVKADGTLPTIRDIQEQYARLQAITQLINWNEYGKKELIESQQIANGIYGI